MAVQNSIFTNAGAMTALRSLNAINRRSDVVQMRVSTGLKVANALDDASNFSISQGIRGEIKSISAVSQGLNNAKGIGKVALAGTTGISNLLQDIQQKITELANEGVTNSQRSILANDFDQLLSQAANFITNAVFNGVSLISTSSTNVNTLSNLSGGTLTLTAQTDLRTNLVALAATGTLLANDVAGATTGQNLLNGTLGAFLTMESSTNVALGSIGSEVRALELQTEFLSAISDATEEGLGNIVDADLARESANLTSLQVQQQLGIQTLGIANQRPQSILGLFS